MAIYQRPMEPFCPGAVNREASEILQRHGRASMKHQIITADDLKVSAVALGAAIALGIIGFMFTFVIAPI